MLRGAGTPTPRHTATPPHVMNALNSGRTLGESDAEEAVSTLALSLFARPVSLVRLPMLRYHSPALAPSLSLRSQTGSLSARAARR